MTYEYRIEHGSYYLSDVSIPTNKTSGYRDTILMTDEVAIAFDKESGTLHKHGAPENVEKWASNARAKLIAAGAPDMAADIVTITGKFPVDELNKCLTHSNYLLRMLEKLPTMSTDKDTQSNVTS